MRILIVDDRYWIHNLYRTALGRHYQCIFAPNVAGMRGHLEIETFDLVILDYELCQDDFGEVVIRLLHKIGVLVCYPDIQTFDATEHPPPFEDWSLIKPFSHEELLVAVRGVLTQYGKSPVA